MSSTMGATSSSPLESEPAVLRPRGIRQVVTAKRVVEGAGFVVRRPLGHSFKCDPFLMLDHFGPVTYGPGEAVGAPDHPHRGQETISYILQGGFQHQDSRGHKGTMAPGDVQWMTAGSGLIHSEMPSDEIMKNGGTVEGFQIWVNLPSSKKMTKPRYQEIKEKNIPQFIDEAAGVKVVVVAGNTRGVQAKIDTQTPVVYYDIQLKEKGNTFTQPIPADHEGFAYVYRGKGKFGSTGTEAVEGQLVELDSGDEITATNTGKEEFKFLLLAGRPIKEPIAWEGPFVMNTQAEIRQAMIDYQHGKFGEIPGAKARQAEAKAALKKSKGPVGL